MFVPQLVWTPLTSSVQHTRHVSMTVSVCWKSMETGASTATVQLGTKDNDVIKVNIWIMKHPNILPHPHTVYSYAGLDVDAFDVLGGKKSQALGPKAHWSEFIDPFEESKFMLLSGCETGQSFRRYAIAMPSETQAEYSSFESCSTTCSQSLEGYLFSLQSLFFPFSCWRLRFRCQGPTPIAILFLPAKTGGTRVHKFLDHEFSRCMNDDHRVRMLVVAIATSWEKLQ